MKFAKALVLLLLLASPGWADLKIEGPTVVPVNQLVKLAASGADAKAGLVWRVSPRVKVSKADTIKGKLQFAAPAGTYEIDLISVMLAADGTTVVEETSATVTIGESPFPPGPVPPTPPVPPADPLATEFQALYIADTGTSKAANLEKLKAIYRQAPATIADVTIADTLQLRNVLGKASEALIPGGEFLPVRTRAGRELQTVLPTGPAVPLTAEMRTAAKGVCSRILAALERVK
jgi:hypothetical protein